MPSISELLIPEIERESAHTRKVLERVPADREQWKPHEKSMEFGYLAQLCATMTGWIADMIEKDSLDIGGGNGGRPLYHTSDLLQAHDDGVTRTLAALRTADDAHFSQNWQLKVNGNVVQQGTRYVMIREAVINHLAHHRGQLTVYLRLNDAMVPAIYGPSADDRNF